MKKFVDKKRYSLLNIVIYMMIVNVLFFCNLLLNRLLFAGIDDLNLDTSVDGDGVKILFLLFSFLLTFFLLVFSGYETRLIGEDKKRRLNIVGKFDWYYKWLGFGGFIVVALLTQNDKLAQLLFLSVALLIILTFDLLVYLCCKRRLLIVIVDWVDIYRIKTTQKSELHQNINHKRAKSLVCIFGLTSIILVVFSNNQLIVGSPYGIAVFIMACVIHFVVVIFELLFLKEKYVLNIASLIISVSILFVGFFVDAKYGLWWLFFVGFIVASYPLLDTNRKIARLLFSKI